MCKCPLPGNKSEADAPESHNDLSLSLSLTFSLYDSLYTTSLMCVTTRCQSYVRYRNNNVTNDGIRWQYWSKWCFYNTPIEERVTKYKKCNMFYDEDTDVNIYETQKHFQLHEATMKRGSNNEAWKQQWSVEAGSCWTCVLCNTHRIMNIKQKIK